MKNPLNIRGYKEQESTVPGNRNRGNRGTKILTRKDIPITVEDITRYNMEGIELTAVTLHLPDEAPLTVVNAYLSPSLAKKPKHTQETAIEKLVDATLANRRVLTVGDLNCKTDLPQHTDTNSLGDILDEKLDNLEIAATLPNTYTRYDPAGRSPSTIDFALTSIQNRNIIEKIEVLEDVGSDHRPVLMYIPIGKTLEQPITTCRPNFDMADWQLYQTLTCENIHQAPEILPNKNSIDRAVEYITQKIQTADKTAIPRKVIRTGKKRRLLPPEIVAKIKLKHTMRNRVQKHNEYHLKAEVNRLNSEIVTDIEEFEYQNEKRKWVDAEDKSPHGFYKLAKRILKSNDSTTTYPIRDTNGKVLTNDSDKIKEFERLYTEIYAPPASTADSEKTEREAQNYNRYITDKFGEIREQNNDGNEVTVEKIRNVLGKTRNTAPGEDGIYYCHIKNLPDVTLAYLAELYTVTRKCCYFPDRWKDGIVILLPKAHKDLTSPKSYRPLTMLPAIGKTFERIINEDLTDDLENNKKLPETQAGFRKKRSTQDQLFKIVQDGTSAKNLGQVLIATLFDIEKAFDKMWIEAAILKMRKINIEEQTIALLQNYLTNRKIRLKINKTYSDPITLRAGTPQGAILSPTIFGIWVGDIPKPTKNVRLSQFADDICTWSRGRNEATVRDQLQKYNDKMMSWCSKYRISLSAPKTQVVAISKKDVQNPNCVYQVINGLKVTANDTVEFLGVKLDKRLNLKDHHSKTMKELKRRRKLLASIAGSTHKPKANTETCLKILHSMIIPVTSYAPVVTCLKSNTMFEEQDTEIRMAARIALHAPHNTRNEYTEKEAKLEPSRNITIRLAKNYLMSENRSESVKQYIEEYKSKNTRTWKTDTPLSIIMELD